MLPRIGFGFDIHQLSAANASLESFVTLGGIKIPHNRTLIAHSDGDVLIHALCDALLGALALGDIGQHFPPSDARWKGADSRVLLRQCVALIGARGYVLGNADMTIICEAPKIMPHATAMRELLAADCQCALDCISVKATTHETLDAIGQGLGISAHAVVLLARV